MLMFLDVVMMVIFFAGAAANSGCEYGVVAADVSVGIAVSIS